jgi:PAS domain S-box-containing protein
MSEKDRVTRAGARGVRFRQMVEDLRVIVWEADADLNVRYVSGRAVEVFGYALGEWLGSSTVWPRLVHPEDRAAFLGAVSEVVSSESESEVEFRGVRVDGEVLWLRALVGAVRGPAGRVRVRGVMLDVTDRRHVEVSARQYAERMRRLLDHSADPLLVHDLGGRIVEANRAACETLGYTRRELLELGMADVQPGLPEGGAEAVWSRIRAGRGQVEEVRFRRRDGTTVPLELQRNLFEWEGQPLYVTLCRDITERRRLEEQLRQSQKLEEVGRLTGGLAHDFRNMLTAIKGHAELLLRGAEADPQRADLEQIAQAAERATVLTRKLLAFSRRRAVSPEALDLNTLVLETARLLRPLIGEHIEVHTALAAKGGVRGDRSQLEQALVNLIVNARDAMASGGRLTLATSDTEVKSDGPQRHEFMRPGPYVELRVADTGHGMDAATVARVFEPFFTTKDPEKGSGLGLSTAYGIVKENGGYVLVESEPGRGSTFTILLPWWEPSAPAAEKPGRVDAELAGLTARTVLVVEDEPAVRSLVRRILERQGHRVLEATDGEVALALARGYGREIDLLVTDVLLPGLGGPALARLLVAERPGLRAVLTSGYGDVDVSGIRADGVVFLEKPFSPDELIRAIGKSLGASPTGLVPGVPEA